MMKRPIYVAGKEDNELRVADGEVEEEKEAEHAQELCSTLPTSLKSTRQHRKGWYSWKGSPITRITWLQAAWDCCTTCTFIIFLSVSYMLILTARGVRLLEECDLTAQLGKNCENIITFLGRELFPHLGATVMVLDRPQSPAIDLCDFNIATVSMNERGAKFLFRQIVKAVQHWNANGVMHADVKSENILIEMKTGRAVLIDWLLKLLPKRNYGRRNISSRSTEMSCLDYVTGHMPHKWRKGRRASSETKIEEQNFSFRRLQTNKSFKKRMKRTILWSFLSLLLRRIPPRTRSRSRRLRHQICPKTAPTRNQPTNN